MNVHTPKQLVKELQAEVDRLRQLLAAKTNAASAPVDLDASGFSAVSAGGLHEGDDVGPDGMHTPGSWAGGDPDVAMDRDIRAVRRVCVCVCVRACVCVCVCVRVCCSRGVLGWTSCESRLRLTTRSSPIDPRGGERRGGAHASCGGAGGSCWHA